MSSRAICCCVVLFFVFIIFIHFLDGAKKITVNYKANWLWQTQRQHKFDSLRFNACFVLLWCNRGCHSFCLSVLRNRTSVRFKVPLSTHAFVFHSRAAQKPRLIKKQKQNRQIKKKKASSRKPGVYSLLWCFLAPPATFGRRRKESGDCGGGGGGGVLIKGLMFKHTLVVSERSIRRQRTDFSQFWRVPKHCIVRKHR